MSNETWLSAKKAKELGFVDEILFEDSKPEPEKVEKEEPLLLGHASTHFANSIERGDIHEFLIKKPLSIRSVLHENCHALFKDPKAPCPPFVSGISESA